VAGSTSKPNFVAITTPSRTGRQGIADEILVGEGGVEESHSAFDGRPDHGDPARLSMGGPEPWLRPMQPNPMAQTSSTFFPSLASA
jgi:hypothetical protein